MSPRGPTTHAENMTDSIRSLASFSLLAVGLAALPACSGFGSFNAVDGSGVPETTTIEPADFDQIDVSGVFEVTVTVKDGPPSVVVTVDDNFTDDLDIGVRGDELRVGFDSGSYDHDVQPTAIVTVASLTEVDLSGASMVIVNDLDGDRLHVDASGASSFTGSGTVTTVSLDASGASDIDLTELSVSSAEVDISGASRVDLGPAERVSGELSGASSLRAPSGASGSIETSGASDVDRY